MREFNLSEEATQITFRTTPPRICQAAETNASPQCNIAVVFSNPTLPLLVCFYRTFSCKNCNLMIFKQGDRQHMILGSLFTLIVR
jgi:hypothetical protein